MARQAIFKVRSHMILLVPIMHFKEISLLVLVNKNFNKGNCIPANAPYAGLK